MKNKAIYSGAAGFLETELSVQVPQFLSFSISQFRVLPETARENLEHLIYFSKRVDRTANMTQYLRPFAHRCEQAQFLSFWFLSFRGLPGKEIQALQISVSQFLDFSVSEASLGRKSRPSKSQFLSFSISQFQRLLGERNPSTFYVQNVQCSKGATQFLRFDFSDFSYN